MDTNQSSCWYRTRLRLNVVIAVAPLMVACVGKDVASTPDADGSQNQIINSPFDVVPQDTANLNLDTQLSNTSSTSATDTEQATQPGQTTPVSLAGSGQYERITGTVTRFYSLENFYVRDRRIDATRSERFDNGYSTTIQNGTCVEVRGMLFSTGYELVLKATRVKIKDDDCY